MEFSIATILSHLSEDKLVPGKVLEKKLGCESTEDVAGRSTASKRRRPCET